jgi:hypothetical protein
MAFPHGDGQLQREAEMNRFASEIEHTGGPKQNPGGPPRERGDRAETLALLIGALAGGAVGILVAVLSSSIDIFTGGIPGVFVGALAGLWIGSRLKKRAIRDST